MATNILTLNLPSSVTLNSDGNGSLTNDGSRSFGYDAENQLTNITLAGQWKSDFVYDGFNRRRIARDFVWQSGAWVLTNETHYIYDGRLLIQERGTNNNSLVTYTRGLDLGGSLRRAGGIGGLLARTDTNGSTFYHADGAGNITALMDGSENIVARYLYGPFGKLIGQWGSLAPVNTMQYSSKPTYRGLVDFGLRWYSPDLARWLTTDPLQERGGINLYRFVRNNPLRYVDPWGLAGAEEENETMSEEERDSEILGRIANGGHETAEEQMQDLMADEAAARAEGRDPNQSYIGPRPEDANHGNRVPCPPKGGVYALRDPATGDVMRTGRSNDLARRQGEHARDPRFGDLTFDPLYRTDDYPTQRGLEQMAHDQYQPPFNYVSPISPGNPNYMNYMNSAQQYVSGSQ
ncbi:MAG: RHS repeat-associated core domain-containing protein [Verrucomicrobiia bacterium]